MRYYGNGVSHTLDTMTNHFNQLTNLSKVNMPTMIRPYDYTLDIHPNSLIESITNLPKHDRIQIDNKYENPNEQLNISGEA